MRLGATLLVLVCLCACARGASACALVHPVRCSVCQEIAPIVCWRRRDITAAQHDARLLPPDVLDANAEQTRLLKAIEPVMNGVITQVMEAVRGHAHEHNLRFERQQVRAAPIG